MVRRIDINIRRSGSPANVKYRFVTSSLVSPVEFRMT